jgi:hypothetical protein
VSSQAYVQDLRPQFRLVPGRDDHLISWLNDLEPRRRSQAIRHALRAYLEARRPPSDGRTHHEDPDLAAALDALF